MINSKSRYDISDKSPFYTNEAIPLNDKEKELYDNTVLELLKEDLWTERDMYDSCHYLMVPMYYVFKSKNEEYIKAFSNFFDRLEKNILSVDKYNFDECDSSNKLHFIYLSSQFMVLCNQNGYKNLYSEDLFNIANDIAEDYIFNHMANWSTEPTVYEYIKHVINGKEYQYSYYGVIYDLEMFSLAIMCYLTNIKRSNGNLPSENMLIFNDLVYELFSSSKLNTITDGNGWLFQVGAWSDYPDMAYAGNKEIYEGIHPKVKDDVTWDSSHFSRVPLFLNSFLSAQTKPERRKVFQLRKEQLANQMVKYVLNQVDGKWLTTTFMDGTNGVYRYSYNTEGIGMEGNSLSGTFLLGWWTLL